MKFYASMRMRIAKGEPLNEGANRIGHQMKINIVKNKVAPPFENTVVDLYYKASEKKNKEGGLDIFSNLLLTAKETGIVELSGSQYRYIDKETGEIHKSNGLVAWKIYLEERPEIMAKITDEILGGDIIVSK